MSDKKLDKEVEKNIQQKQKEKSKDFVNQVKKDSENLLKNARKVSQKNDRENAFVTQKAHQQIKNDGVVNNNGDEVVVKNDVSNVVNKENIQNVTKSVTNDTMTKNIKQDVKNTTQNVNDMSQQIDNYTTKNEKSYTTNAHNQKIQNQLQNNKTEVENKQQNQHNVTTKADVTNEQHEHKHTKEVTQNDTVHNNNHTTNDNTQHSNVNITQDWDVAVKAVGAVIWPMLQKINQDDKLSEFAQKLWVSQQIIQNGLSSNDFSELSKILVAKTFDPQEIHSVDPTITQKIWTLWQGVSEGDKTNISQSIQHIYDAGSQVSDDVKLNDVLWNLSKVTDSLQSQKFHDIDEVLKNVSQDEQDSNAPHINDGLKQLVDDTVTQDSGNIKANLSWITDQNTVIWQDEIKYTGNEWKPQQNQDTWDSNNLNGIGFEKVKESDYTKKQWPAVQTSDENKKRESNIEDWVMWVVEKVAESADTIAKVGWGLLWGLWVKSLTEDKADKINTSGESHDVSSIKDTIDWVVSQAKKSSSHDKGVIKSTSTKWDGISASQLIDAMWQWTTKQEKRNTKNEKITQVIREKTGIFANQAISATRETVKTAKKWYSKATDKWFAMIAAIANDFNRIMASYLIYTFLISYVLITVLFGIMLLSWVWVLDLEVLWLKVVLPMILGFASIWFVRSKVIQTDEGIE